MKYIGIILFSILISISSSGQAYYNMTDDTIYYMYELSTYVDTNYLSRYEDVILEFEKSDSINGISEGQVLFLGSSSFNKWLTLQEDMYPIPVINRGFGGSTMSEAVYYFNRIVKPYKPSIIVLYEGDNDITAGYMTHDVILETFKLFVRLTEKYLPSTQIYFLSIKPSPVREEYIDKLLITNMLIEEYCRVKKNLFYIDITEEMYDHMGGIREDIFLHDKLHLNRKGYEIWTKIVKDALLRKL